MQLDNELAYKINSFNRKKLYKIKKVRFLMVFGRPVLHCESALYQPELQKTLYVCPKCDHHLRIGARTRFNIFFDNGNFTEIASNVETGDPLGFKDVKAYPARIKEAKKNTGESEALLVGFGKLDGRLVTAAAFEFKFMGGSMGSVVGEKFVQGIEQAIESKTPFICFSNKRWCKNAGINGFSDANGKNFCCNSEIKIK